MLTVFKNVDKNEMLSFPHNQLFRFCFILAITVIASACAHHSTTVISIDRLGCASCLDPVTDKLQTGPGVKSVAFNKKKVELHITYDAEQTNPEQIFKLAKESGELRFVMGAGKGSYPESLEYGEKTDVETIVKAGEAVDIEKYLAPGKITIVDFSAVWCGPCRALAEHVYDLMAANPALALRKIEIVDWDSPISLKYLGTATELPYIRIYDKNQKFVGDISGFKPEALELLIEKAAK